MKFLDPYLGSWIWFSELATTRQTAQNADGSSAPLKVAPLNNSIQHSDSLLAETVFTSFIKHERPKQHVLQLSTLKNNLN